MLPDIANGGVECIICELICGKWRIAICILRSEQVASPSHVRIEGADGFTLRPGQPSTRQSNSDARHIPSLRHTNSREVDPQTLVPGHS